MNNNTQNIVDTYPINTVQQEHDINSVQQVSFWKPFGWTLAILGVYLLTTIIAAIACIVLQVDEYAMGMISAMASGIMTSVFVIKKVPTRHKEQHPDEKSLKVKTPFKIYAIVVIMMITAIRGIQVVTGWITEVSGEVGQELMNQRMEEFSNSPVLLLLLLAIIIAPITEEIVFRYGIYGTLRRSTNIIISALLSAVIFGAIHFTFEALFYGGVIGIVFALLYEYTRNIKVSITGHMTYNITVIFVPHDMNETISIPVEILLITLAVAAFVSGLYYIQQWSIKQKEKKEHSQLLSQDNHLTASYSI